MSSSRDHSHINSEPHSGDENEITGSTRPECENVPVSQEPPSPNGFLSAKSSQTQVGLMSNSETNGIKQGDATEDISRTSKESNCDTPCPTTDNNERQEPRKRSTMQSILLVATCTVAMILNTSSSTSASISLPRVGDDFGVPEDNLQWVVSAYSLSSGCFYLFFGRLADLYGRKKAFLLGSMWLGVFSIGAGFSKDIITLDILRAFQGLGPAAMVPAALGILAHTFPPSRARSLAFATFSAGAPVGGAIGLQIGGILTQWAPATWRAPYFLSAGLAAGVVISGIFVIDKDVPSTAPDRRVDWIGVILVTAALVLITFVLGEGELASKQWRTPYIIALLIIGILLLISFVLWEWYLEKDTTGVRRPPLMKLSMMRRAQGRFAAVQFIAFFEWASFLAWQFWAQLYYQDFQGLNPILTAIRLLPMFVVGVGCNVLVAATVGNVPIVLLVVCGTLCTGLSGLLFAVIQPESPYWAFGFPAAIVSVFGADFVFACGTIFLAKISAPHEQSLAGGLFQTMTQLGTSFGLAITTIVHNTVLRHGELTKSERDAQLGAFRAAQWTAFGFGAAGAVLALIFLRGVGPVGQRHPVPAKTTDLEVAKEQPLDKDLNDKGEMP